jgi:Family of unknown function (DUF6941)
LDATIILCDAAEEINGKLYILGGGWAHLLKPNQPTNVALAIMIHVPLNEAGRQHKLEVSLLSEDGEPVRLAGNPVRLEGAFEVGALPRMKPERKPIAPVALQFVLALPPGDYVWELRVDDATVTTAPFWVQEVVPS